MEGKGRGGEGREGKGRERMLTVSDWQISIRVRFFISGEIFSLIFMNMWLSLVGCKKANKQFGDISTEERLFNDRAERFWWPTISWNK